MKKIAITFALAVATLSSFGQGHVVFSNFTATKVSTNSTVNYLGEALVGGTIGLSPTKAQGLYYYALLAQSYVSGPTVAATLANVMTGGWTYTGVIGTNALATGSIAGGSDTISAAGLPLAAGNQFVVVGWSAGLGNTWATISAAITGAIGTWNLAAGNYIGISAVGTGVGSASPPEAIFGGTGITSTTTLFSTTTVPEPGTIALAGLGGLALLALRRRNK